ncbi:MAG TPA: prolyl oligopeptidase family serine peptidase, partial [Gaiellaceae bacterium]
LARREQLAGGFDTRHGPDATADGTFPRDDARAARRPRRRARGLGWRGLVAALPAISPLCHRADFPSQGGMVRAALCRPAGSAEAPALVVLHGCGGIGGIDEVLARDLPAHGVATFYVDYFGLMPPPGRRGFCGAAGRIGRAFPVWQQIVVDATAALRRTPGIDPARVGALGWSMGGGLALATAQYGAGGTPLRRSPFRVLVLLSTYDDSSNARAMPPTLVLSGGRRDAVPESDAIGLSRALRRAGVPVVLHVYPGGTHAWKGAQRVAAERWTLAFLRRYLSLGAPR